MCDEGRFGFKYVQAEERLTVPEWKAAPVLTNGFAGPRWMESLNHVRDSFKQLAKNDLGDRTNCTPAISDGQIFIRTNNTLWCIE